MGRVAKGGKAAKKGQRKSVKSRAATKRAREPTATFAELQERLAEAQRHQSSMSEVLEVISASEGELQPVFKAILKNAIRLCEAKFGNLLLIDGRRVRWAAGIGTPPKLAQYLQSPSFRPTPGSHLDRVIRTRQVSHSVDDTTEPVVGASARLGGARSTVCVPMVRDKSLVGAIFMYRTDVRPFADGEINLVKGFAAQAVIAVENARLFNETKEALERQTATADVLRVIASSPTDVQPVFDAIAERSNRLIGGHSTAVYRFVDKTAFLTAFTSVSPEADAVLRSVFPRPLSSFGQFELVSQGKTVQIADYETADVPDDTRLVASTRGFRSCLFVPLLSDHHPIGLISVTRKEPGAFDEHDVKLLKTFADQAVIAIQNVRLFDEVQQKTRDLSDALTYQIGSANILSVIASSPTAVDPVLKAIVESACELCDAYDAVVRLRIGDELHSSAHHGPIPVNPNKRPIIPSWTAGRAVIDKKPVQVHDILSPEGDEFPETREMARRLGHRTILSVPLLREGDCIGVIVLRRKEVNPFSDKQIALLQTFADQAVIAIGNVRLFEQVQERTRELSEALTHQTGSANILRVIASSPTDIKPVLKAIVESACELCDAYDAVLRLKEGDHLRLSAHHGPLLVSEADLPINPDSTAGLAMIGRKPVHVRDLHAVEGDKFPKAQELAREHGGERTILSVPLVRAGESIGAIIIRRREVNPFSDNQIALLQTFADEAVIAISNVGLFEQLQQRTRELSHSLDDLRTAQDRLIQTEKLASLGQLTAGIAHEIKNPLNFVNNFSALSAELTDELNDLLKSAALTDKMREEVGELTGLLKNNLEKVVQHGKRADSIVKNMLLHSRQGSGEHRSVDINSLVDESLNLAYHGARAEKTGFNITMQRDFDPAVGMADVYPQEITRVLLNLISNGFYATMKRQAESGDGFEPTLSAATKSLGDKIEIRIRDNGTGIPAGVKEKIFNPFFTTKPAGEGTGLGLSMSHDIIVKQHGGTIDLHTEPGAFTEFRIVLPRAGASVRKSGEHP